MKFYHYACLICLLFFNLKLICKFNAFESILIGFTLIIIIIYFLLDIADKIIDISQNL